NIEQDLLVVGRLIIKQSFVIFPLRHVDIVILFAEVATETFPKCRFLHTVLKPLQIIRMAFMCLKHKRRTLSANNLQLTKLYRLKPTGFIQKFAETAKL